MLHVLHDSILVTHLIITHLTLDYVKGVACFIWVVPLRGLHRALLCWW